jgi:hypothetical protein
LPKATRLPEKEIEPISAEKSIAPTESPERCPAAGAIR